VEKEFVAVQTQSTVLKGEFIKI